MNIQKTLKQCHFLTKELTKNLINGYKILNGAKHVSLRILQNYSVFISTKNTVNFLLTLDCLRSNNISIFGKVTNLYISYTLDLCPRYLKSNFPLNSCLFRTAELSKNANRNKYKYSCYGIRFDSRCSKFLPTNGSVDTNVIIFWAGLRSSVHLDIKNEDIFFFGGESTEGLGNTTLTTEGKYVLILHNQENICIKSTM